MSGQHSAAVLTSDAFLGHDTGPHVEQPARIAAIRAHLEREGLLVDRPLPSFTPADRGLVAQIHSQEYLAWLDEVTAAGGGWIDGDTLCAPDSVHTAYLAAGAAVEAVRGVVLQEWRNAFVIARPPGHHALANRAMGFCLINSIAVAAQAALNLGLDRVAIIDWDVHHGNGTQAIFWERPDVFFASVQQFGHGFFPGSGSATETGAGAGAGTTLNVPLRPGAGDSDYLKVFDSILGPAIEGYAPELILVSAGFDAHRSDPLGSMQVTEEGFAHMADRILALAGHCCEGRFVAILEGGYDQPALARSVATVLRRMDVAAQPL